MVDNRNLDDRIYSLFKSGTSWVDIERQLGVDRHAVYRALKDEIQVTFGRDIIDLYIKGFTSRMIYNELDIRSRMRCGGESADYIVTRYLLSLPRKEFARVNEERRSGYGNTYRFTALMFDQDSVLKKHRQGFQVYELANLFNVSLTEVKDQLGIRG